VVPEPYPLPGSHSGWFAKPDLFPIVGRRYLLWTSFRAWPLYTWVNRGNQEIRALMPQSPYERLGTTRPVRSM
jgi:hypothetical protein